MVHGKRDSWQGLANNTSLKNEERDEYAEYGREDNMTIRNNPR